MTTILYILAAVGLVWGLAMMTPGIRLRQRGPIIAGTCLVLGSAAAAVTDSWLFLIGAFLITWPIRYMFGDESQASPLHNAIIGCDADMVRRLLAAGADPECKNSLGQRPLEVATRLGYTEIVDLIAKALRDGAASEETNKDSGEAGHDPIYEEALTRVTSSREAIRVALGAEACTDVVAELERIIRQVGDIPEGFLNGMTQSPHDVGAFDVNRLLDAFPNIRMEAGYCLDYIYAFDHDGGQPYLYARKSADRPIASVSEFSSTFGVPIPDMLLGQEPTAKDTSPYLGHMVFENSPQGFFEFAAFIAFARRFYLHWHSLYNARCLIVSNQRLEQLMVEEIGGIPRQSAGVLCQRKLGPQVVIAGSEGVVIALSYLESIGYTEYATVLRWPNVLLGTKDNVILHSRTKILY
jgi:hypothetical protein